MLELVVLLFLPFFFVLTLQEQIVKHTVRVRAKRWFKSTVSRIKDFRFAGNTVLTVPLGNKMKGSLKIMVKTKEKLLEANCGEKKQY